MDKELPKSQLTIKPGKLFVKLSKCQLPGQAPFYRGTLPYRQTLNIDNIATRAVKARSSYSHGTFVEVFRTMVEEIYNAIEDGFNVDFGLGRTELIVTGRFNSPNDAFDRERHAIRANFRASPRLNQLTDRIPAEVSNFYPDAPQPNELSIYNERYSDNNAYDFCHIPPHYTLPLFIHGRRLKVMGDAPEVGIVIRQEEGDKRYFITPRMVFINQSTRLAFMIPEALTPGRWVAEVWSQYAPNYIMYKNARMGDVSFTVSDDTLPG